MIGKSTDLSADHPVRIAVSKRHGRNYCAVCAKQYATALNRNTTSPCDLVIVARVLFVFVIATRVNDVDVLAKTNAQAKVLYDLIKLLGSSHKNRAGDRFIDHRLYRTNDRFILRIRVNQFESAIGRRVDNRLHEHA